jgi:hypothetical protein
VLEISSDYSVSDIGQLKTRVEAFVEVLQGQREDRRSQSVTTIKEHIHG